ncbi:MAG: glycoside hydrolase family 99-like domain-containing protein [Bacteroidetes bacterium]|nr:glycoside hydrolase family 99-like domain-containing protein [Bacteroidota bacterium]
MYDFGNASKFFTGKEDSDTKCIPTIISGWDHSPRSGKNGLVLHKATPGKA